MGSSSLSPRHPHPHSTRPWEPQLGLSSSTRGGGTSMNPIASRTGVPTLKHPSSASLPSAQPPDYREFTPGDLKRDSDPWYSNPKKKKVGNQTECRPPRESDRVSTASRIRQSVDRHSARFPRRPTLCPISERATLCLISHHFFFLTPGSPAGKTDRVSTASRIRQSVDRLENQTECRPTLCPIPPTADTLSDFRAGDTLSDFPPFFFSDPW